MKSFELKIIKPTKSTTLNVEWIDVKTPTGNFYIGPDHYNLITIIKERSPISYKKINNIEPKLINSYGGFLKIENGKVLIILDL